MYTFAILVLLALATIKVVDFLAGNVAQLDRMRSLLTFVVSIGAVMVVDYSMFDAYGVNVDNRDMAVLLTGLMTAGLTSPWRALFTWLTHDRAMADETLGQATSLRKVA
ncbi:MAG: hypothetical protein ACSLFB_07945 [Acidimicrobiales bacterium]